MNFNLNAFLGSRITLLSTNVILGSILVYSYYHYITYGGASQKQLWGKSYPYRKLYLISMILAGLGYLVLLGYVVAFVQNRVVITNLLIIQTIIIAISMLWLPLTLSYLKHKSHSPFLMLGVLLVLGIVALAAIQQVLILAGVNPDKPKSKLHKNMYNIALAGGVVFAIHVGIFDFIGWNTGFFS